MQGVRGVSYRIVFENKHIYKETGLHWACVNNSVASIRLFLGHKDCNQPCLGDKSFSPEFRC